MKTRNQSGFSLVELLIAIILSIIILSVAGHLYAKTRQSYDAGAPVVDQAWMSSSATAELSRMISDSSAKLAYHDVQSTIEQVRRPGGGGGGGTGGPPEGYCLVVAGDESTYPPGFDPRDQSTWTGVDWWEGIDRDDPSTWYWNCEGKKAAGTGGGGGGGVVVPPHELPITPVIKYGNGFLINREIPLSGPVTVSPEGTWRVDEVGDSLTVIRTQPESPPLRLGSEFSTTSQTLRLVARDERNVQAVENLYDGDLIAVVGRDAAGGVHCGIFQVSQRASRVAAPSVTWPDGEPVFIYFDVPVSRPDAELPLGLANSALVAGGVTLRADAAVALLHRHEPVVTYLTKRADDEFELWRLVGNPAEPAIEERVAAGLATPLSIQTELAPEAPGLTAADRLRTVTLSFATAAADRGATGQPVSVHLELLNGALRRTPTNLIWDVILPGGAGGGGGGK